MLESTLETSGRPYRTERGSRRMLKSTLAMGLANRLNTEVDYSIGATALRFCIDCVAS